MTKFFLVMSSPRSGSTLLAQCLNAHSNIVVPGETDFLGPAAFICTQVADPDTGKRLLADLIVATNDFKSFAEYLTPEEAQALILQTETYSFSAIVHRLYAAIACKVNKQIAADKSPNDMSLAAVFRHAGLFAEPTRVIHLVRDPRDVTESLMRQNWVPGIEEHFPRRWVSDNLFLRTVMDGKTNYMQVRYEDFVAEPEDQLGRICAFLGIDPEDAMLDTTGFHKRYEGVPAHVRLYDPVSPYRVGTWKDGLDAAVADDIMRQASEGLEEFGYV